MTDLKEFLNKYTDKNLRRMILSNARSKEGISKIQVRPVEIKGRLVYQATKTLGTKELHENYDKDALTAYLCEQMTGYFRQLQFRNQDCSGNCAGEQKRKYANYCKRAERKKGRRISAYAFS